MFTVNELLDPSTIDAAVSAGTLSVINDATMTPIPLQLIEFDSSTLKLTVSIDNTDTPPGVYTLTVPATVTDFREHPLDGGGIIPFILNIDVDTIAPTAALTTPEDNGSDDQDPTDKQVVTNVPLTEFVVSLDDGVGSVRCV